MNTTLKDIASIAGVSISTVSRVLNKNASKHRISRDTEKIVLKTAAELNYRPNQLARGLRVKKTQSIGLVLPDISNPFFSYVGRSIQRMAHQNGYSLIICDTDEDLALEIEHLNLLRSKGVDGLIIMPVGQKFTHLQAIVDDGMPLVLIDRCFEELNCSSVVIDNYLGSRSAMEHMIACGHRRIAFIQGLPNTYTNTGRLNGYLDALSAYGIPVDEKLIVGKDFRRENGYIETKFLLNLEPRPTAIFSTSDLITLGALQAISEEGLQIPQDISLVAFDDVDFAPYLICSLTTVAQPKEHMGEMAVKILIEYMKNPSKKSIQRIILKPKLIIRNSVLDISFARVPEEIV